MAFKAFIRELKDRMIESIVRAASRGRGTRWEVAEAQGPCNRTWDTTDISSSEETPIASSSSRPSSSSSRALHHLQGRIGWANLPPELLLDIVARVETSSRSWPSRRDLVACASVCRSWRLATMEVTRTPEQCGGLTFPSSLKQAKTPIQCFIKRDRSASTYRLYLGLTPALSGDMSKLLLVARKMRRPTSTDFIISLAPDDFSQASTTYVGRIRSNFLGTKFTIYDSQLQASSTVHLQSRPRGKPYRRSANLKQVSPRTPVGNFSIATVSYELNVLRTRGPRRMHCAMHSIPTWAAAAADQSPSLSPPSTPNRKKDTHEVAAGSGGGMMLRERSGKCLVLKNKAPRWHEQLQCWCLNFRGRVTVASVKNFQLVAAAEDGGGNVAPATVEQEAVILQFGKIGKDIFTMDYRYPVSAFQAFAICLSSFDTKPTCE
ncbi:hypothetical protein SAY86_011561 [Trapa natans]|uniref:Tubby-like F-box protein n=1 Tax=Trapa natans TaxID=22666 RepID=A0AAN7R6J6_TRANT|nr:hypothetical protein SAY86_011561 [Trapa natans]